MPDRWIDDHVGDESRARAGFEDELAGHLHREWSGASRRTWLRVGLGVAAAVALVVGAVVWAGRDDEHVVTVDSTPTTAPVVTSVPEMIETVPDSTVADADPEFTAVQTYLDALRRSDWDTAAALLIEGGLEPEARADLRPLFDPQYGLQPRHVDRAALAAALEAWCARAVCQLPFTIADRLDGWTKATYRLDGDLERSSMFAGSVFEGQPGVRGLPLQLPPSKSGEVSPSAIVDCPDDGVDRVITWADLDGDGWLEQLVPTVVASAGDESGVRTFRVYVCGSDLVVEPFDVTGDGLAIYPLNPTRTGPDTLLVGFLEGYPNGTMYQLDGSRITEVPNTKWDMGPPLVGYEQMSVGCADVDSDGTVEIANYTYTESGGRLVYTVTPALGGADAGGDVDATSAEADAIRASTCHGLPVRTD